MILTPIDPARLPMVLDLFAGSIEDAAARAVFRRIARPEDAERATGECARLHHRQALALLARFGMGARPGSPAEDFSWNGEAVRTGTEAYVLLHEIAHFQLASPARRRRVEFGLGPGEETGARAEAEAQTMLFGLARDREEAMASLLGVLWEVELGQPGLASLLDQNWLEGAGRPSAAAHFCTILAALQSGGFVTEAGRPTLRLRETPDPA